MCRCLVVRRIPDPSDTKPADWQVRVQSNPPARAVIRITRITSSKPQPTACWHACFFVAAQDLAVIPDPTAVKPSDWEDREKIPDPAAVKPKVRAAADGPPSQLRLGEEVPDCPALTASGCAGGVQAWLDDEPALIDDPTASQPSEWDEEVRGRAGFPGREGPQQGAAHTAAPAPSSTRGAAPQEDGVWEAPKVANPKCRKAGCGQWKPPLIANPAVRATD
jgi:calnexin